MSVDLAGQVRSSPLRLRMRKSEFHPACKNRFIEKPLFRYLVLKPPEGRPSLTMQERIVARLTEGLDPLLVEIADESERHAGHAGARPGGGTHYRVKIVSPRFAGLNRVARHRLVYALLPEEFAHGLHALALDARAPSER